MRAAWIPILLSGLLLGAAARAEESGDLPAPAVIVPADARPAPTPSRPSASAAEPVPPGWVEKPPVRYVAPATPATSATPATPAIPVTPVVSIAPVRERPDGPPRIYDRRGSARFFCCPPRDVARGPFEIRDEFLLAQPRLTLPATSPDPLGRGRWLLRIAHDWGNDFGWSQVGEAESPVADRRFFVDGEHRTVHVTARYGILPCLDVGVRVPVHWRGGGFMDGVIDWWHDKFGFRDNGRSNFDTDRYRVQGRDAAFNRYAWTEEGFGLGNVELEAHWAFLAPRRRSGWRAALVGRVGVPTGTGPYETGSVEAGLQVVAAKQLWRRFDLYGGAGGTWYSEDTIQGFQYEPVRGYAFLSLEYRISPVTSLIVQTDASSRLITNLVDYPDFQSYLQVGARFQLSPRTQLFAGLTENLYDQQSTVDVGVWGGLEFRL